MTTTKQTGSVHAPLGTTGRVIDQTIEIAAPPDAVWRALSDAEEITRWFAPHAEVTDGVGGRIFLSWGPGFDGETRIEVWEPGRHLRSTDVVAATGADGAPLDTAKPARQPLTVDYYLEGRGGSTVLRLVHSGFGEGADWDKEYDNVTSGWAVFLGNLRYYLEAHGGKTCAQAIVTLALPVSPAAAWPRLLGSEGLAREGKLLGLPEGSPYRVRTAAGDLLEGTVVLHRAPNSLSITVDNAAARLNLSVESMHGATFLFAAYLSYGGTKEDADALRDRWTKMFEAALPAPSTAEAATPVR